MKGKIIFAGILALVLGAVLGVGAGYYLDEDKPQLSSLVQSIPFMKESKLGGFFKEPESPLPAMPGASKFLGQLDPEKYPVAAPLSVQGIFKWNFSGRDVYAYDFTQRVEAESEMMGQAKSRQEISGAGDVILKSKGDRTADMVMKNLKLSTKMTVASGGTEKPREMEGEMPTQVVQGIVEAGSGETSAGDLVGAILFPTPGLAMKVGDSVERPMQVPFNAMGSMLYAKGKQKIRLTGFHLINGRVCGRLETDFNVDQMEVPQELEGNYQMQVKGKSVFYFDAGAGAFHSGRAAALMSIRAEAPAPKMDLKDANMPKEGFPEKMRMTMDSDNLISVSRNRIKERVEAKNK